MSSKIDVSSIIRNHFDTLRLYGDGKLSIQDIALFYVVPGAIIGLGRYLALEPEPGVLSAMSIAFLLFTGLLLCFAVLMYGLSVKLVDVRYSDARLQLVEEFTSNVLYAALVSFLTAGASIFVLLVPHQQFEIWGFAGVLGLFAHLSLTMFMVMKRTYALMSSGLSQNQILARRRIRGEQRRRKQDSARMSLLHTA